MEIKKYKKKPVIIEAIQYNGKNLNDINLFTNNILICENDIYKIPTLEGNMEISKGDYVIKGINGEFYPCKPDIFEKTYEEV